MPSKISRYEIPIFLKHFFNNSYADSNICKSFMHAFNILSTLRKIKQQENIHFTINMIHMLLKYGRSRYCIQIYVYVEKL